MSLDYALGRYPPKVELRDGTDCVIRRLEKGDAVKLEKFFQAVQVARHVGLKRLETELIGERKVAIHAMEQLGFREICCLPDYVMNIQSRLPDYVVMAKELRVEEEFAGVG